MAVYIRTELKEPRGVGHWVRCFSLGQWLIAYAARVTLIVEVGESEAQFYSGWIESAQNVGGLNVDIVFDDQDDWLKRLNKNDSLIVDSYTLSQNWIAQAVHCTQNLMLIDDDPASCRQAPCIIDPTISSQRQCQTLGFLGAEYYFAPVHLAKLHFEQLHYDEIENVKSGTIENKAIERVFISFGGTDVLQLIPKVIDAMAQMSQPPRHITIAVAQNVQHSEAIENAIRNFQCQVKQCTVQQVNDRETALNELLKSDLAVGAVGGAMFERALLGVPSMVFQVAANQHALFNQIQSCALAQPSFTRWLGNKNEFAAHLLEYWQNANLRVQHTLNGFRLTHGLGCSWVAQWITRGEFGGIYLKLADMEFKHQLYRWQIQEPVRRYSRNNSPPSWEEHDHWFDRYMSNPKGVLCEVRLDQSAVGMVRFDLLKANDLEFEISILIDPDYQGKGYAKKALQRAAQLMPFTNLKAYINPANQASIGLFESCGYSPLPGNWYIHKCIQAMSNGGVNNEAD